MCEACGKLIEAKNILSAYSVETKNKVELKPTAHLTINCQNFYEEVDSKKSIFPTCVHNKLVEQKTSPEYLDISRDKSYYGISIDKKYFSDLEDQYFYVWFDAPIGYLTFSFEASGLDFSRDNFNYFLKHTQLEHNSLNFFFNLLYFPISNIIVIPM